MVPMPIMIPQETCSCCEKNYPTWFWVIIGCLWLFFLFMMIPLFFEILKDIIDSWKDLLDTIKEKIKNFILKLLKK